MYVPYIGNKKSEITDFMFMDMKTVADELLEDDDSKYYCKPAYSVIGSISLGYVKKDGSVKVTSFQNEGDEKKILIDLFTLVANIGKKRVFACYMPTFILPYLRTKALKYGIFYPWNDCGLKPWEIGLESKSKLSILDIGAYHRGISPYPVPFVDFLTSLGVEPTGEIDYDVVGLQIGDYDLAVSSSEASVKALIEGFSKYYPNKEVSLPEDIGLDLTLRSDSAIKYEGITISAVKKVRNKNEYRVQLSDNSDLLISPKIPPKKGDLVSDYL